MPRNSLQNELNAKIRVDGWGTNGEQNILNSITGVRFFSTNPNNKPALGVPSGLSEYGSLVIFGGIPYVVCLYVSVFGQLAIYNTNQGKWTIIRN